MKVKQNYHYSYYRLLFLQDILEHWVGFFCLQILLDFFIRFGFFHNNPSCKNYNSWYFWNFQIGILSQIVLHYYTSNARSFPVWSWQHWCWAHIHGRNVRYFFPFDSKIYRVRVEKSTWTFSCATMPIILHYFIKNYFRLLLFRALRHLFSNSKTNCNISISNIRQW